MRNLAGAAITSLTLVALLTGCGGGGSAGNLGGGSNSIGVTPSSQVQTKFHVDVTTGKVTVVDGTPASRAIFSGSSVGFNSSVLLDQSGADTTLKTLNVSLTNNWGESIGNSPNGMRVVFGPFINISAPPVISVQTNVSTIAGSGVAGFADGSVSTATFTLPSAVISGGSGSSYVTDFTKGLIRKISSGQVTTLAGGGAAGANGVGKTAGLVNPVGIAINPVDGAIVIAELGGNRIRRMTPAGSVSTIAGTGTASAVNGSGASATFNKPYAVAVDSTGTIYVSDFNNHLIRKIVFNGGAATSPSSYTVSTLSGSGVAGSADGTSATATFIGPGGIAFDPSSNALYLADTSANRIRMIDLDGNATTVAGTGTLSEVDGNGSVATFNNPRGVVVQKGSLIVSDGGGNTVRQISRIAGGSPTLNTSWLVQKLAGTGSAGSANGLGSSATFNGPLLIGADASGNILVPDSTNNKIRMVQPTNGFFPVGTTTGSNPAEHVQLSNASGYVDQTDGGINAPYITYLGTLNSGATTPAQSWSFVVPNGINAFEFTVTVASAPSSLTPPTGDASLNGSPTAIVHTFAGSSTELFGFADGLGGAARFQDPLQVSSDGSGVLYVVDALNSAIRRISPNGLVSTIIGFSGSGFADGPGNTAMAGLTHGIAASPDGTHVFFSESSRIRLAVLTPGTDPTNSGNWTITTIAGGASTGTSDGLGTVATFTSAWALALAPDGALYISDLSANNIRKMFLSGGPIASASSWSVITYAGSVIGSLGDTDGVGTSATFHGPQGVAVDGAGVVYVADSSNFRIRKITLDGVVSTLAGGVSGDTPTTGDVNGSPTTARFDTPDGIVVDSAGYLYVPEFNNRDVRRISPQGVTTTVAGKVSSPAGNADGPGNLATFSPLGGIGITPAGDLFVGDEGNNTIREIERAVTTGTQ